MTPYGVYTYLRPMPRPRFDLTRLTLKVFAFFGSKDAKQRLRQDRLRRLEASIFLDSLKPEQRLMPMKRLRHKFNHKHPL